ncbi:hypothetical protein [Thermogemmatispora tikiterensis]|uniref:Uncharacterized protein n=1 Tax=Thermogemmatispora tikiterensis TaxID=1825093 RepID=A0A328VIK5_9CHLR|nr:hypothetical protein [Thermogemmatispora tikiterensis]RAQ95942.1 hypothetical protein A4R35_10385 [Thermogemmatispora tikiterensis]
MQDRYPLLDSQTKQITGHFLQSLKNFLAAAQAGQQRQLQEDLQDRQRRLVHQERLLEQAARDGLLGSTGISLLLSQLNTWAEEEALKVALRYPSIDLAAQGGAICSTFQWQLAQEIQARWSALQVLQEHSWRQRQIHYQEQAGHWQTIAQQAFEEQRRQQAAQVQWWTQVQQQAQQAQQHWAGLAYQGVEMVQHGLEQHYRFAEEIHRQAVQQLGVTARRQELLVEQAVRRAAVQRWATRCLLLLAILIAGVALFGCAALAAIHLLP